MDGKEGAAAVEWVDQSEELEISGVRILVSLKEG